jgi:hypothetical protein
MAYDVEVEWLDGVTKVYSKVTTAEKDGLLIVRVEKYYGASPITTSTIPLNNVREVRYP